MLVLSRSRNEAVIVGDDVRVTLLDIRVGDAAIRGAKVRLGFEAPKEIPIQRQEVFDRINAKASSESHSGAHSEPHSGSHSGASRQKPEISGKRMPVHEAAVRLQIQTPPDVAIHCSRASKDASGHHRIVPSCETESRSDGQDPALALPPVRVIDCRKEDNILIGNQLLITIVDVFRFVPDSPQNSC